jgi:hypothetical protein
MDSNLIPAILTYVRDKEGFATKTKLLKLLYLLDLEAYRETRQTLTGFNWKFHLYGPWAPEYDSVLTALEQNDKIVFRPGTNPDLDTVFLDSTERVPLETALPNVRLDLKAKRIIEAWANRPTGEILDYVYFHTSPMRDAKRGMPLDLSSVWGEESPLDSVRRKPRVDEKVLREKRRLLLEALRDAPASRQTEKLDPPPRYDEQFFQVIDALDEDSN